MAHTQKVRGKPRKDGSRAVYWQARWRLNGVSRCKNFTRKGDADAHLIEVLAGRQGGSNMLLQALAEEHLRHFESLVATGRRGASSRDGYVTDLNHLKKSKFAKTKVCDLTTPKIQQFLDDFIIAGGSVGAAQDLRRTLGAWCKFGQRRGWMTANPAQAAVVETTTRPEALEERVEIPPKEDLRKLLAAANDERSQAMVRLLMFGGLRISELLGLSDELLTTNARVGTLRVRERLDRRYITLGPVKSAKARRDVPIGQGTVLAVKAFRLARGKVRPFMHNGSRVAGRLFPNPKGTDLWSYQEFYSDFWKPLIARAEIDYFGVHQLRHVAASLWIAQGLQPKKVQELLGHSTILLTMNLYGHLWADEALDDQIGQGSEQLLNNVG